MTNISLGILFLYDLYGAKVINIYLVKYIIYFQGLQLSSLCHEGLPYSQFIVQSPKCSCNIFYYFTLYFSIFCLFGILSIWNCVFKGTVLVGVNSTVSSYNRDLKNSALNRITFISLLYKRSLLQSIQVLKSSGTQTAFSFTFCYALSVALIITVQGELQASHPCSKQKDGGRGR